MRRRLASWCIIVTHVLYWHKTITRGHYQPQKLGGQVMGNNNTHLFIGMDVSEKNINIYALPDDKDVGVECQIKNGF